MSRPLPLDGSTAADVADAEVAIARLNHEASTLADSEAMARLLLRAEAVASSRIEGLEIGGRRLLKADLARGLDSSRQDVTATEVLNNIEAMHWAVGSLSDRPWITVEDILAIHERLLADTRLERYAGRLRDTQNWVGGNSFNPGSAAFRTTAARASASAYGGSVRVLQRGHAAGGRPGRYGSRSVRDRPPARRR